MSLPTSILALYPFLVLFLQAPPVQEAQPDDTAIEVQIHPAGKQALRSILPAERRKADATPSFAELLQEAVELLPADASTLGGNWLFGPIEDFPAEEAKELLASAKPAIARLKQAVRGSPVNWDPPPSMDDLSHIRALAKLLTLKARLQIAERHFEAAAETIGTGYALARTMTAPRTEAIHGMVGVAIGSLMTEQLLALILQPAAPSLSPALRALPDPLIDLEPVLNAEVAALRTKVLNPFMRKPMAAQLESSHARMRQLATKLQGQITAVRLLDELRVKSAGFGELPANLNTSTPATRPANRITIRYKRLEAGKAELTVATGEPPEQTRYHISLMPAGPKAKKENR
jgi:hypothetical protein